MICLEFDWFGKDWIGLYCIRLHWIALFCFGLDWISSEFAWNRFNWFRLAGLDWIVFGLDWIGLDWMGLDWIGMEWIGLDWVGLESLDCIVLKNKIFCPYTSGAAASLHGCAYFAGLFIA